MSEAVDTRVLIKNTVRDIYFKEGKFGATTQEIADAAGVNRTLINYYFRSRDNLVETVFLEAMEREEFFSEKILFSDFSFREKIACYIERNFKQSREFPYLESYIVSRLNEGRFYGKNEDWERFFRKFKEDFKKEVKKGTVNDTNPIQFMLNLTALISFPFAARPLLQSSLRMSDQQYEAIIDQRKEVIMKVLFKN